MNIFKYFHAQRKRKIEKIQIELQAWLTSLEILTDVKVRL